MNAAPKDEHLKSNSSEQSILPNKIVICSRERKKKVPLEKSFIPITTDPSLNDKTPLSARSLRLFDFRISVIFRVKSAKAVKITDMNLLKRLGIIVTIFSVFLGIRTLVAPPVVIVARTADDLKAYLCRTDWWDHSFTTRKLFFSRLLLAQRDKDNNNDNDTTLRRYQRASKKLRVEYNYVACAAFKRR